MINECQKKLRRWFRSHGWRTVGTGIGWLLVSPVENVAGLSYRSVNPDTGENQEYTNEMYAAFELDGFRCEYVNINIFKRKHWWKRDSSVPDNGFWYSYVPSDDFEEWPREPTASISIPARDIVKMAELIKEGQKDCIAIRTGKASARMSDRLSKHIGIRWIGVNSSYDEIKRTYSNERLKKERGTDDAFSWKP